MRIILLGPPAVGKGTQASLLSKDYSVPHISTGDIMRSAVASGTELGLICRSYMDKGELVPDTIVVDIIKARLAESDCSNGFILDGFPRNLSQAMILDKELTALGISDIKVIELTIDEKELFIRLSSRQSSGAVRADDNSEVLKHRIEVYKAETKPVSDFYQAKGCLKFVSSMDTIEEVHSNVMACL